MIRSLLPVVQAANNVPIPSGRPYPTHSPDGKERYVPFHLTLADYESKLPPVGLLRPQVVAALQAIEAQNDKETPDGEGVWHFHVTVLLPCTVEEGEFEHAETEDVVECVYLSDKVLEGGPEGVSAVFDKTLRRWQDAGEFASLLSGEWPLSINLISASASSMPAAQENGGLTR